MTKHKQHEITENKHNWTELWSYLLSVRPSTYLLKDIVGITNFSSASDVALLDNLLLNYSNKRSKYGTYWM